MKLHQLIALIEPLKARVKQTKTEIYKRIQKDQTFNGFQKTYRPDDDEGFVYPSESQRVENYANKEVTNFLTASSELFDTLATQDATNQKAVANVVVDNTVVLQNVPVTTLLMLEKQLQDFITFFRSLPVLESSEEWSFDSQLDMFKSAVRGTVKKKKVTKPVVFYEATKEHPAQVREVTEDVPEGIWENIKYSGALPQARVNTLVNAAEKLLAAVRVAREEANSIEVEKIYIGKKIAEYFLTV